MTWFPFDLHPEYPPEGIPRSRLTARYGESFHDRLRVSFAEAGLGYNPPPDMVPNTMRALCMTEFAREQGLHGRVHDRLMQAYWEEARDIGDPGELRALGIACGLDTDELESALESTFYRERIRSITSDANSVGITAIPAFVLDRRLLVLGAQPRTVFEQAVSQLRAAD